MNKDDKMLIENSYRLTEGEFQESFEKAKNEECLTILKRMQKRSRFEGEKLANCL